MKNPFLTYGYAGPEYFCDREKETARLNTLLENGNHVALISPRRIGKTGLIKHCFAQSAIQDNYYTFIVDIYATTSLAEFTYKLGLSILNALKSKERKAWEKFLMAIGSLRSGISLDEFGKPSWNLVFPQNPASGTSTTTSSSSGFRERGENEGASLFRSFVGFASWYFCISCVITPYPLGQKR